MRSESSTRRRLNGAFRPDLNWAKNCEYIGLFLNQIQNGKETSHKILLAV